MTTGLYVFYISKVAPCTGLAFYIFSAMTSSLKMYHENPK